MRRAVIIDLVRTPFGRARENGVLATCHPVDLYAHMLKALVRRTGIDPALVEDVITGCVIQVGEQAANIGRQAVLAQEVEMGGGWGLWRALSPTPLPPGGGSTKKGAPAPGGGGFFPRRA